MATITFILQLSQLFFLIYLLCYATFLFFSVILAGNHLYKKSELRRIHEELRHDYDIPVSVLVPAYNEEVTIVDSIKSLLNLDYPAYEIIVISDGSTDNTARYVKEAFSLKKSSRSLREHIACKRSLGIYESVINNVSITLIEKENGGKGDTLNMGINASSYPYFLCLDADSVLQKDSLKKITVPLKEHDHVIAVGGLVQIAQGVTIKNGIVTKYQLPWNPVVSSQIIEYDCSFLGSRILMDSFQGNLIISGAFGLFRKDLVIAVKGYDTETLGEDMELVMKLHYFCRNNQKPYQILYESDAICWSQAPSTITDLCGQRRRWFLGLLQCMSKYRSIFANLRFGAIGIISYLYYFVFELFAPMIEIFGIFIIALSIAMNKINFNFFLILYAIYTAFCSCITFTAFLQRIYSQNFKISIKDVFKAIFISLFQYMFLHWILSFIRIKSLIGYEKKKHSWGTIGRMKQNTDD
ncbi:MAG: glycosyltransferase [Filifactor alocis]|nr:glycosyltransferase [Filifactor alocis]